MWRQWPPVIAHAFLLVDFLLTIPFGPKLSATLSLKIDAASCFFPVAVAGRVQTTTATHFFWPRVGIDRGIIRLGLFRIGHIFGVITAHDKIMPEPYNSCSIEKTLNQTNTSSVIAVTGPDSFEFLQGQLSNDLKILESYDSLLSAWCNPKGRVICLMTVTAVPNGYSLEVPANLTDELIKRLTLFRFRSKVEFGVDDETSHVAAAVGIENGIPWIGAEQSEKFTPHMLNLDLLEAINLDKGCYTGQEIVARTHYKGATKRRTLRFESDTSVSAGDDVLAGDRKIGEVLNAAGNNCLAVVAIDKIDAPLTVQDSTLELLPLAYLDV